jgi:hypothetical protein
LFNLIYVFMSLNYCSGDQIENNEMGGACSTYGEWTAVYSVLVENPEVNSPLGRLRRGWEDIIEKDPEEVECGGYGLDQAGLG